MVLYIRLLAHLIESRGKMKGYKVNVGKIKWPEKCAYCGADSDTKVKAKSSAVKKVGYFIFFLLTTSQIIELQVPVCNKHKLKALIASKLSARNQLNLMLGVLSVFAVLGPVGDLFRFINGTEQPEVGIGWRLFLYGFPVIYWTIFFWAKSNAPVLIQDLNNEIKLYFKNDKFSHEFGQANDSNI